jgi:hypothetical protein
MITQELQSKFPAELAIELCEASHNGLVLRFRGTIEQANPGEFLDPLLDQIHQEALRRGRTLVTADFTQLGFLNSSGIKSLIKWVMKQMYLGEDTRYGIKFLYSSRITWQVTSLKAITNLSRGTVLAEPV